MGKLGLTLIRNVESNVLYDTVIKRQTQNLHMHLLFPLSTSPPGEKRKDGFPIP